MDVDHSVLVEFKGTLQKDSLGGPDCVAEGLEHLPLSGVGLEGDLWSGHLLLPAK
jgi:hypothetical protein